MTLEKVYVPSKLGFVSPAIVLQEFLQSAFEAEDELYTFFHHTKRAKSNETEDDTRKSFFNFIERNGQFSEAAEQVISEVDNTLERVIEHFPIIDYEPAYPPLHSKLMSHKVIDDVRKSSEMTKCKTIHISRGRYYKYRDFELERPLQPKQQVTEKDLVMTVHMMKPSNSMRNDDDNQRMFRSMCEMKFVVRGDMPLKKLRDKIFCQSDLWCNLEDNEDASDPSKYFMNQYPSGFFFIYDTFYVDDSSENCKDISKPIQEFMTRKTQSFNEYHVKKMSEAHIIDLKLRLGFPYIFVHGGHCEHLMIFTDLRLMNVNDTQALEDYPLTIYDTVHSASCCACKDASPTFVVTESDRMPICPAFMCESCFRSFHYDNDMRIGNFKAYHYVDRGGIE